MIYFMHDKRHNSVKIGRTSRQIIRRQRELQSYLGSTLEVLRVIEAPDWVEKWFHNQFMVCRIRGEWFSFHPEMLALNPPCEEPQYEERSSAISIKMKISLRGAIETDRQAKGQSLVEWLERAARAALTDSEVSSSAAS